MERRLNLSKVWFYFNSKLVHEPDIHTYQRIIPVDREKPIAEKDHNNSNSIRKL